MRTSRIFTLATMLATGCVAGHDSDRAAQPDAGPGAGTGSDASPDISASATTRTLTLQTAIGGQFVSAENGGGGDVNANRAVARTWETFTLYDLNGGALESGDLVNLGTVNGHFVCAENGGGGAVNATRTAAQDWETFRVVKVGGSGAIADGDQIALQTKTQGLYVSAINGGGAGLLADRTAASGWESFVVGGSSGGGGGGTTTTEFAPYFYTWGWDSGSYAFSSLADMKSKGGPAEVTIAFVLAGNGCDASTDIQDHLADVQAYTAAGGHVKASFGGADGTYLEYACSSSGALAGALERFVDATGVTDLDFDLEQGGTSSNASLNSRRAAALEQVQNDRHVRIAFTLPVGPGGLEQDSLDILQAVVNAGVTISYVNGMTMDYGDGTNLGTVPIQSSDNVAKQIRTLLPSLSLDQAYRMVGATAMIGKNDDNETFSLDNARTLIAYAKQKKLGLVSYWAIQRDEACAAGGDLDRCSRVNASLFQFSDIFASVNAP